MRPVTAAVVEKDGKYMICRRGPGRRLEGVWEFPGGKLEQGETPEEGLARELYEELGVEADVGAKICEIAESEFGEFMIMYYHASIRAGEPRLTEHTEIKYVLPCELAEYTFSSADAKAAALLAQEC